MLILSIDTATPVAGVSLVDDNTIRYEGLVNNGYKHSRNILGMIDTALRQSGCDLADVDAIAVTTGPGSFTGLRIGLATAKGLALAAGKPLIGIPTLDAVAHSLDWRSGLICPVMNARKGEVYASFYRETGNGLERLSEYVAVSPDILAGMALGLMEEAGCRTVIMAGDGVKEYRERLQGSLGTSLLIPPEHWLPRASSVGVLAARRWAGGQKDDVYSLVPNYVRPSEAEVKLLRAGGNEHGGTDSKGNEAERPGPGVGD